jgi:hypothetical protein
MPAVRVDDAFRDREAEADAAAIAAARLPEAIEQVIEMLLRNARTGVGDAEHDLHLVRPRREHDAPAGGRELDRVADEVAEHLEQTAFVGADEAFMLWRVGAQLDVMLFGGWIQRPSGLAHERAGIDVGEVEGQTSGLKARRVEQIANEPIHLPDRSLGDLEHPAPPRGRKVVDLQQ